MKALFNILVTVSLIGMLVYRIWENVRQPHPDKAAILLQFLLLLFGIGMLIYRLVKLRKSSG